MGRRRTKVDEAYDIDTENIVLDTIDALRGLGEITQAARCYMGHSAFRRACGKLFDDKGGKKSRELLEKVLELVGQEA